MMFINKCLRCFLIVVCVLFFIDIVFLDRLHAQQFKVWDQDLVFSENAPLDSIQKTLINLYKKAELDKDSVLMAKSLIAQSVFERKRLEYGNAFNYAGEALFLAEEINEPLLLAQAYEEMGVLSYLYKQDADAGANFKSAHKYYSKLHESGVVEPRDLFQSNYNLLMYYQRIADSSYAKNYINKCAKINKQYLNSEFLSICLDEKRASVKEWLGETEGALNLLLQSAKSLERVSANNEAQKSFLIIVYGRLASNYEKLGDLRKSKFYFEKSVEIDDFTGENGFYKSFIYGQYARFLYKQGLYKEAYENEEQSELFNNTYLNPRNDRNRGFLTIRNRYKDQLIKKNEQLNKQSLELAEQRQDVLRFRILFFVILFVFVVLFFLVRSRIRTLKFQKKEQDSNALIEIKNKELTVSTLQLIEREEVIKMLRDHLRKMNLDKGTRTLLKSIEKRSVSLWDAFNNRFVSQNEGFYERLQEKVPNLSAADLKICALIKLNFSGKEMAYLLGISLGSVHVARHRLRKKMNLSRDVNLTNFINSI